MDKAKKAKSVGFASMGVSVGSVLTFRRDASITCTVVDDKNKVEYQGKVYSISGLAKELMKTSISGIHAFKYEGTLLAKLNSPAPAPKLTGSTPARPPEPPTPAPQEAPVASVQESAPNATPQPMPLPRADAVPEIDPLAGESDGEEEI